MSRRDEDLENLGFTFANMQQWNLELHVSQRIVAGEGKATLCDQSSLLDLAFTFICCFPLAESTLSLIAYLKKQNIQPILHAYYLSHTSS